MTTTAVVIFAVALVASVGGAAVLVWAQNSYNAWKRGYVRKW